MPQQRVIETTAGGLSVGPRYLGIIGLERQQRYSRKRAQTAFKPL